MNRKSERREGMRIDWDVEITMEDGIVLRADVYRPIAEGRYPVILSYGPYGKWLTFQDGYPDQWRIMAHDRKRKIGQRWTSPEEYTVRWRAYLRRADEAGAGPRG